MQQHFYATTKDRKGGIHNYKLATGEGVPKGHEITDLSVAHRFKMTDILSPESVDLLEALFPGRKARNAKA
jgi:hypothetical protein